MTTPEPAESGSEYSESEIVEALKEIPYGSGIPPKGLVQIKSGREIPIGPILAEGFDFKPSRSLASELNYHDLRIKSTGKGKWKVEEGTKTPSEEADNANAKKLKEIGNGATGNHGALHRMILRFIGEGRNTRPTDNLIEAMHARREKSTFYFRPDGNGETGKYFLTAKGKPVPEGCTALTVPEKSTALRSGPVSAGRYMPEAAAPDGTSPHPAATNSSNPLPSRSPSPAKGRRK